MAVTEEQNKNIFSLKMLKNKNVFSLKMLKKKRTFRALAKFY